MGSIGRLLLILAFSESLLERRDQNRQGSRLLIRGEMTARQALDLEAELAQSFMREVDLPVLKGVLVTAAHQERELIAISLEEVTEVEPITLRFVISHETRCGGEVEQAVVTVHSAMELAELGVCYVIAFGPHLPYSGHPLEQRERSAQALAGPLGEAAQRRGSVPGVGVAVPEEPAIEDENTANVGPARGFASLRALKPTPQYLQNDKRGKVEGDQCCGLDRQMPPERFDEIGALGRGIGVVLGLVAVAHAHVVEKEFRHAGSVRQMRSNSRPPE